MPLLCAFVSACLIEREAAQALADEGVLINGHANPWLSIHKGQLRILATLAAKLRLAPSARFDRRHAGRTAAGGQGRAPLDWKAHFAKEPHDGSD